MCVKYENNDVLQFYNTQRCRETYDYVIPATRNDAEIRPREPVFFSFFPEKSVLHKGVNWKLTIFFFIHLKIAK